MRAEYFCQVTVIYRCIIAIYYMKQDWNVGWKPSQYLLVRWENILEYPINTGFTAYLSMINRIILITDNLWQRFAWKSTSSVNILDLENDFKQKTCFFENVIAPRQFQIAQRKCLPIAIMWETLKERLIITSIDAL